MRYRKMTPSGDYFFGPGSVFLVNTPEAVAQAVRTRVKLYAGEWFLDRREGLDLENILGYRTQATRDREIQQRILSTPGVRQLTRYSSSMEGRQFRVDATVETIYGSAIISEVL